MKVVRGVFAALALLALIGGAPILLAAAWEPPDLGLGWRVLLTPDDGRLLICAVVLAGWVAWGVFVGSVAAEVLERAGHRRLRMPHGPKVMRASAAFLVGSLIALATLRSTPTADVPPPRAVATAQTLPTRAPAVSVAAPVVQAPDDAKGAVEYTVTDTDDLWTLAERLLGSGTRWHEITSLNPRLDPREDVRAGQVLRLPSDAMVGRDLAAGPAHPSVPPLDAASGRPRTVIVQRGDSLWKIAERTLGDGDRWPEIYRLNQQQIVDPDEIDIGWELRLPGTSVRAESSKPSPAKPSTDHTRTETGDAPGTSDVPTTGGPNGAGTPAATVTPVAPAPAPAPAPANDSEANGTVVAGESAASPALLLLGGAGPLLAAGMCASLVAAREIQEWGRPRGRRFVAPGAGGARVETALRLVADPPALGLVDTALRLVGEHCQVFGMDPPPLSHIRATPRTVVLNFVAPPPPPPDTLEQLADTWVLHAGALDSPPSPAEHPYPALVTLGMDGDESVLLDLTSTPLLGITGSLDRVAAVANAWVLELTAAPWAPEVLLHVSTSLTGTLVASRDDVHSADPDELVGDLETLVATRREGLPRHGLADLRPIAVFVFGERLTPALRERLVAAKAHEVGVAVVLADDAGPATWDVGAADTVSAAGRLSPGGLTTRRVQQLSTVAQAGVAELRAAAESLHLEPAPWWCPEATTTNPPHLALSPVARQEDAMPGAAGPLHPLLNILGPIELLGTTGTPPARGQRTCMEYCAWLLEHGGSTAPAMVSSLLVAESSRRSTMSRLRIWLGKDEEGKAYLPDAYSGRIWLHPAVSSDWQQLQILIAPGVNRTAPETLQTALGMVRGGVMADAAPGQWSWAEELRMDIMATVRDIALVLTDHALAHGEIDLARWATARALTIAPEDEELLCARIRTERRAGNHREVERLALKTTAHARRLGIDLRTDTVLLLQEVMEGRIRARSVTN